MTISAGPRIEFEGLGLSIDRNTILEDLNLTIEAGTVHCLIGPNGGGKSSLVKTLLGQTRHSGRVAIHWPDDCRTIGYVPQSVAIDKTMPMTVLDFVTMCVQQRPAFTGLGRKLSGIVSETLAQLDMKGKEKAMFADLSGGERQRVLFAQALIPKPRLLILDEPMNSIDRNGAEMFSRIIREAAQGGTTVIWIHHDLAHVKQAADAVSCVRRKLLFSGKPADVMTEKNLFEIFSAS